MAELRAALSRDTRMLDGFRALDRNGDGVITRAEFATALPRLGLSADAAKIDALFRSFDLDGDGCITYQELRTILKYEARRTRT